ncbi:MAG: XkdX family protein [Peptococcaceae bacterium]|nr:XkdX family protein [Peptococcaceae bacterium]
MSKTIIQKWYKNGIYSKEDVAVFVQAGELTEADYEEITGEAYDNSL